MSNLTLRVLTALLGAPLVLGLMYLGGWPFVLVLALAALGAQHELYGLLRRTGVHPYLLPGLLTGALLALRPLLPWSVPAAVAVLLALIALNPFQLRDEKPLASLSGTVFGALYPAALLGFIGDLRLRTGGFVGDEEAFYLTLLTFVLVWSADTFAYFAGRTLGKRPLAPKVSPKKTWEGSIGGALGAVLVAILFKLTLLDDVLDWTDACVVALICGIISQLGDLAESKLKRSAGAKDSGTILPGHGGLLDRLDALILAAPLVYLYLAYVARIYG